MLESHCGAARFAFNHMLGVVKANLDQRNAERSYGIAREDLTPSQGWSLGKLRKTWNHTGTGSRPAASHRAGDGRGAIQETSPTTTPGAVGTAGGDEASTPHTTTHAGAGTATPQGEAA